MFPRKMATDFQSTRIENTVAIQVKAPYVSHMSELWVFEIMCLSCDTKAIFTHWVFTIWNSALKCTADSVYV